MSVLFLSLVLTAGDIDFAPFVSFAAFAGSPACCPHGKCDNCECPAGCPCKPIAYREVRVCGPSGCRVVRVPVEAKQEPKAVVPKPTATYQGGCSAGGCSSSSGGRCYSGRRLGGRGCRRCR